MIGSVARRGRWHEFLSQFNIEVVYVPGKDHQVSDALSRWAYPAGSEPADASFHGTAISAAFFCVVMMIKMILMTFRMNLPFLVWLYDQS